MLTLKRLFVLLLVLCCMMLAEARRHHHHHHRGGHSVAHRGNAHHNRHWGWRYRHHRHHRHHPHHPHHPQQSAAPTQATQHHSQQPAQQQQATQAAPAAQVHHNHHMHHVHHHNRHTHVQQMQSTQQNTPQRAAHTHRRRHATKPVVQHIHHFHHVHHYHNAPRNYPAQFKYDGMGHKGAHNAQQQTNKWLHNHHNMKNWRKHKVCYNVRRCSRFGEKKCRHVKRCHYEYVPKTYRYTHPLVTKKEVQEIDQVTTVGRVVPKLSLIRQLFAAKDNKKKHAMLKKVINDIKLKTAKKIDTQLINKVVHDKIGMKKTLANKQKQHTQRKAVKGYGARPGFLIRINPDYDTKTKSVKNKHRKFIRRVLNNQRKQQ